MIWIIDDDIEFSSTVKSLILNSSVLACSRPSLRGSLRKNAPVVARCTEEFKIRCFTNAIEAISCQEVPELIFLDILLDGPDGFTFLNEMRSYEEFKNVPVVIMSSLNFKGKDLSAYGVVGYLNKSEMTPAEVAEYIKKYASGDGNEWAE
ncbi:response regulator [Candidatus Saccharibacteria bacterium]|nr:response regulator [Candidatus Saccharibacteria bacterium]